MLENPPLLTVRRPDRRPSAVQLAAFRDAPASFVADAMGGTGSLRGLAAPGLGRDLPARIVGPALTAGNRAGDVMASVAALRFVQPGDIVVAAVEGHQGCAAAGDLVIGMARNAGAAGFVTDGPLRDYAQLVKVGLPVWSTGLNPASPTGHGPGTVGLPVMVAGRQVESGDIIVADADGVVVVPFARIDAVIAALARVRTAEAETERQVAEEGLAMLPAIAAILDSDRTRYLDEGAPPSR